MEKKHNKLNEQESKEQELKLDLLIDSWYKQLELHNKIFDTIDKKVMWFFTFVSAIEWYLIINYFISKNLNWLITKDFILIMVLIIGVIILWIQIYILRWKKFCTWPNIYKQTKDFWQNEKTFYNLKKDTLSTLNDSYNENDKIILLKSRYFRYSVNLLIFYFVLIILYFLI